MSLKEPIKASRGAAGAHVARGGTPAATGFELTRRAYQEEVLTNLKRHRSFILLWRRQGGKTTSLAECATRLMMTRQSHLVTFASASLLLGREMILKEADALAKAVVALAEEAQRANKRLWACDGETGRILGPDGSVEQLRAKLAEVYAARRLELRMWHDQTSYSRTQVIAPNPATARGWTGTVVVDEFGFLRDFRELWEALEPIVSTSPAFRLLLATTPPEDDAHLAYELTAPPTRDSLGASSTGHWYWSPAGKLVHRVDIHDAHRAGLKVFDLQSGEELTPEEHFQRADDKDAWRRNYLVQHIVGGLSACGLPQLESAQRRGQGQCACVVVDDDADFDGALEFLRRHLGAGAVGLGWDPATTEQQASNPSAFCVMEQQGVERLARLVVVWKTRDPQVALERARRLVEAVAARGGGGRARRLCIDATNERYFAGQLRHDLGADVPVELMVGSESVQPPGAHQPMTMKQWLGSRLVQQLDDNRLTLPPERYLKDDFRLVKRERGAFVCAAQPDGRHGDTFDAAKLANHALESAGGVSYRAVAVSRVGRGNGGRS